MFLWLVMGQLSVNAESGVSEETIPHIELLVQHHEYDI